MKASIFPFFFSLFSFFLVLGGNVCEDEQCACELFVMNQELLFDFALIIIVLFISSSCEWIKSFVLLLNV